MIADLAEVARKEIGTEEDPKHTNKGSSIKKYQDATILGGQGWPWCAAFISWCIEKYVGIDNVKLTLPRTASAFQLIKWGEKNGLLVFDAPAKPEDPVPQPGDVVVFTFSHCGIVSSVEQDGCFKAIEGNTNPQGGRDGYEVAERLRTYRAVKKFIRLTEGGL